MSELNIGGIQTVADLRAEAAEPKPEADLDRNAFCACLRHNSESESAGSHEKRGFRCSTGPIFELRGHNADVGLLDQFVTAQSSEKIMRGASLIGKNVFASVL